MHDDRDRKPRDEEIDVYGLTHRGRVRDSNQDHFLICLLRRQIDVLHTSLPEAAELGRNSDRAAFVAMVADGAGGADGGESASRMAVEAVTRYVTHSMRCYYTADADDATFAQSLHDAAMRCHQSLVERGEEERELRGMATTLTLWMGVWPRGYLLQVGDSRAYLRRGNELTQISRDQTMAQELVDLGALPTVEAASPRMIHTLSSSIGGPQPAPTVTRF